MLDITWSFPGALRQHRPPSTSYMGCVRSIWDLHDETVNIWTHLIAFAVFFAVCVSVSTRRCKRRTDETCANNLYFPAATLMFLCSTLYHTFANHDNATFWRCLDHCSITAFIWASSRSFTLLAYGNKRNTAQRYTTILTAAAISLVLWDLYDFTVWNGPTRTGHVSHAVYGTFAAIPAFNRPSSLKWRAARARKRLLGSFQTLIWISTLGAVLYTTRLIEWMTGERWGKLGHHTMHMALVVGACVYGREVLCSDLVG
jgi:adiponectin receptor